LRGYRAQAQNRPAEASFWLTMNPGDGGNGRGSSVGKVRKRHTHDKRQAKLLTFQLPSKQAIIFSSMFFISILRSS
ncbi:MAG: hypothetical protein WHV66_14700, partial [Anaerolineales bacterium]